MKYFLLPILTLLLASCADSGIKKTYVSSGDYDPIAIYIREFDNSNTVIKGEWGRDGEMELRAGQAPAELAQAMKAELAKIAPTMIIEDNQFPTQGWLVEGEIDYIDSGYRIGRGIAGVFGAGQAGMQVHVKVSDAKNGRIVYAFDIEGTSGITGRQGNTGAPGAGYSRNFLYKNTAMETMRALSIDPMVLGRRQSP